MNCEEATKLMDGYLDGASRGELSGAGFPLIGGRLDYLDNHPVAALTFKQLFEGQILHRRRLELWSPHKTVGSEKLRARQLRVSARAVFFDDARLRLGSPP